MLRTTWIGVGSLLMWAIMAVAGQAADPLPLTDADELFNRLDRNRDGRIEASEIDPVHARLFRRLLSLADANGDGALSREEFAAGLKEVRPERPLEQLPDPPTPKEIADATFRKLDANRDGKLVESEVPDKRRPMFRQLLRAAGKDRDGSLTLQEFETYYAKFVAEPSTPPKASPQPTSAPVPGAPMPTAKSILARLMKLDINGDGRISSDEARGPLARHFGQFDTNGDGYLDRQELERAAEFILKYRVAEKKPQ